jgi:antitoxin (DNA-binding transcriptional repressor) of toxin-antitoxin stability system
MHTIQLDEITRNIVEILQRVHDQGESYEVIDQGQVVARLVPPTPTPDEITRSIGMLDELEQIAAEITWPEGMSAADAVRDVRRDL